ncbi:MAG: hypothetical protein RIB58_14255 [Phycisphaerales bacterium]
MGASRREAATTLPQRNAARAVATLVSASPAPEGPSEAAKRAALELEVARSNRQAASIDATDARWVFACRVAASIEGGRAAILRPEARDRLLNQASALGLRAFDANLVIAIVQDSARCGQEPLGLGTADRLPLVRPAHVPTATSMPIMARVAIAAMVGVVLAAVLIRWVLS